MSVDLSVILFNHDPGSSIGNALNIRKDFLTAVSLPEWQQGVSRNPSDSPAAYSIAALAQGPITIMAGFTTDDPAIESLEIRAVVPPLPELLELEVAYGLSPLLAAGYAYYAAAANYVQRALQALRKANDLG